MPMNRLKMRSVSLAALATTAIVTLSGCFGKVTREDVPGTVPYGSVEQVAQRSTGSGSGSSIDNLGLVPLAEWKRAVVPMAAMPRVNHWWLVPQWSEDGYCQRDGTWLHIFPDDKPRWALKSIMQDRMQSLSVLTNLAPGPDGGQLTFATSAVPDRLTKGIEAFGKTYRLPYTQQPMAGSGPGYAPAPQQRQPAPANAPTQALPESTSTAPSRVP